VREAVVAELKRRRRSLLRALVPDDAAPWSDGERLAQLALVSHDGGWLSVCEAVERVRLRRCLSRFAGGEVAVPEDRRPPSRAYRKLLEAELRSGVSIAAGERCVDLGAAPGSWSWVALQRGARVLAVDRAALRADLMRHPRLRFVRGNAFSFAPDARDADGAPAVAPLPVDWLLCDVIAFPARTLELLQRWASRRWCRRFVVTVKFKGEADYPLLQPLKAALDSAGCEFALCQLGANKNEVTAWGSVPEGAAGA
jgi:23S rRNA (cytidine2498-2'-O)-methyltransferase